MLKTERLLLRKIETEDKVKIFEGLSNPEVIRYYGISYETLEDTTAQMKWYAENEENQTGKFWAICLGTNSEFMGVGGLYLWSRVHQKAEAGFWLLPQYWNQGYMTEAMNAMIQYGFDEMNLHRIEGFVENDNLACKQAMQKLSFRHEGTMVDCEIKMGKRISLDIYARIKPN